MAKGMGFEAAANAVAKKSGVSKKAAAAIVASASQKASPAAKKANPNLKKVPRKGTKKTKRGTYMSELGIVTPDPYEPINTQTRRGQAAATVGQSARMRAQATIAAQRQTRQG